MERECGGPNVLADEPFLGVRCLAGVAQAGGEGAFILGVWFLMEIADAWCHGFVNRQL